MQYIKRLPSGFYMLAWNGEGWTDAALIPWDGKRGTDTPYNTESENFNYYIAADNTVYYCQKDGSDAGIWCPGSSLQSHCRRLSQITARAAG